MQKLFLLALLLFVLTPGFSQKTKGKPPKTSSPATTLDLSEALNQKLVSVSAEGTGGHEGESIKLICRNLRGQLLRLRIPQGLLMDPADSSMQTLVVAQARTLSVSSKTPAEVRLKTFCTQAGDRSPATGTAFAIGAMAPDKLCQLLKYMSDNGKTDTPAAQSAVWAVTNNEPLAGIDDPDLIKFTASLVGKRVPGYRVQYETREVPGQRAELGKAMLVESSFQYTLAKDEVLSTLLLDTEGKLVKTLRDNEPAKAGEHRSGLRLQAWNLKRGNYTVRVQTKSGRVIQDIDVEF